ncbi:MAG: MotA/TolQ/ExbB proton channel family protein [Ignavibacteria bacterium]|nr:MAG: MotA/TolQ/ExbB proton channel family protein [Ignavibacteria bacterium]
MTVFDLFLKGGIVMWFILAASLLATAIIVQKLITLSRVKTDGGKFILQMRSVLSKGDISAALSMCSEASTPLSNILRVGLLKMKGTHQDVKDAVESAARMEVYKLERGLGLLASVAGIAPLLGFLGTVTGMIGAFRVIEVNEGVVNPQLLASGIWEALLTTAFGLIVGIPAYFLYNYLVNRVSHFVFETENSCNDFLDIAQAEQRKAQAAAKKAQLARQQARGPQS